jgi:RNA polymerase sigma factor (sigma-70 family)
MGLRERKNICLGLTPNHGLERTTWCENLYLHLPRTAPTDMPDDQLMLAYAAGDAAAFDTLYTRHQGPLFRFVRRLLGSALVAQADEVFQDTWVRIISARTQFSPQGASWKTWAFTIAHNLAMDRLRVSGREVQVTAHDDEYADPLQWLQESLDMSHPSSEDTAFWRAAGTQLLHCLDELPGVQRAAFLLHHEEGASVEELARSLNLNFETAKSRLRYALTKLRTCMQAYLVELEPKP